ncbi:MAG: TlpA family protein disulfide reductase [Vicinamibacterales bacterium]
MRLVLADMRFRGDDPAPGAQVPPFDLVQTDGSRLRAADLASVGPVLLVFGSSTCPVTDNAAPGLKELHRRFGSRVRIVLVNVREAHPGAACPQPLSMEEKICHAQTLRELHGLSFSVAVDDIDGTLHRALSPKPNSAYLLGTDGTILFRAHWANDTAALTRALEAVAAGAVPAPRQSGGLMPMVRMIPNIAPVLDRAGAGAWADMWRVAPPLAALARILKAVGIGPGLARVAPAPASGEGHA